MSKSEERNHMIGEAMKFQFRVLLDKGRNLKGEIIHTGNKKVE